MIKQQFAENLRLLCSYKKSISEVCRNLSINRQQFNKYLSGRTTPSGSNLRKICDYFGVDEHEIFMPHEDFEPLVRLRPEKLAVSAIAPRPEFDFFDKLLAHSTERLDKYEGSYHIYYYSTSYPTKILKGYGVIFQESGRHFFKWIERLSIKGDSTYSGFSWKLKGLMLSVGNRLFITGYEQALKNEMFQIALFPTYKNKVSLLSGLMLDLSGSDTREPVCVRLVLSYLGRTVDHRSALRQCGVFDDDSPEISDKVKSAISNRMDQGETIFKGRPI